MKCCTCFVASFVVLIAAVTTNAQLYWDSNGTDPGSGSGDGTWSVSSETWDDVDGGDTPSPWIGGSDAVFSSGSDSSGLYTVTVDGTHTANSLTFEDGFPTLSGGQIDLAGTGGPVSVPSAIGQTTINSVIGGSVGLTATGQGVLLLGGANVYTGDTSIGTATEGLDMRLTAPGAIPDTSLVTLIRGNANTALRLSHNTGSQFDVSETIRSITSTGTGGAPTIHIGANTLTLADPQGETANVLFSTTAGGKVIKKGSGALSLITQSGVFAGGEFIIEDGDVTVGGNNVFGTNANDSKLTMLGGSLTYNGGQSMNTERLDIGGSFDANILTNGNAQFFGGGDGPIVLETSPTITVNPDPARTVLPDPNNASAQNGVFILGGIIQDDGAPPRSLIKDGEGILTLSNPSNSYTGETTILNGYLRLSKQIGAQAVVGDGRAGTARINLSGGGLTYNGSFNAGDASRTLTVANAIRVTNDSGISYISNTPNLAAGTPPADAHNIYFVFTSNDISTTGGTLTFSNDGVCTSNGNVCTFRPTFSGNFNYNGPVVVNNQIDDAPTGRLSSRATELRLANTTGTQTWSNVISGTGSLRRTGAGGISELTADNSYQGGTTVDNGTLRVASGASLGDGDVTVSGGILDLQAGVLDAIANTALLSISGSGIVSIAAGVNDVIASIALGGGSPVTTPGTYGSLTSGADFPSSFFQGNGTVEILATGLPGDYNDDETVDAADYVFWRKMMDDNFNDVALPNDDTPGVGEDDYERWVQQFNEAASGGGGGGSVPEPGTIMLAVMALFAAGNCRRRRS